MQVNTRIIIETSVNLEVFDARVVAPLHGLIQLQPVRGARELLEERQRALVQVIDACQRCRVHGVVTQHQVHLPPAVQQLQTRAQLPVARLL